MPEKVQKLLNDSAAARWTALILIASMMFFAYMFVDVMSPLKSMIEAERGTQGAADIKTDTAYTLDSSMKSISHSDFSDGQRIDFCAEGDTVYFYNPDIGELYSIKYDGSGKTQLNPSGKFFWYECVSGNELFGSSDDEPALFNIETGSVIKLSENK